MFPDIQTQRIFAVNTPFTIDSLTQLMRGMYPLRTIGAKPQAEGETGEANGDEAEGDKKPAEDRTIFTDAVKAEDLLKRMGRKGWVDIETSVQRTCSAFK